MCSTGRMNPKISSRKSTPGYGKGWDYARSRADDNDDTFREGRLSHILPRRITHLPRACYPRAADTRSSFWGNYRMAPAIPLLPVSLSPYWRTAGLRLWAYYNCDTSTIRVRFEYDSSTIRLQHAMRCGCDELLHGCALPVDDRIGLRRAWRRIGGIFTRATLCLCLSQVGVLSKWMNGLIWFWYKGFFRPVLHCVLRNSRHVSTKIRVLPSGTFS